MWKRGDLQRQLVISLLCAISAGWGGVSAYAQTESTAATPPAATVAPTVSAGPKQIWDYAEELEFTTEQRTVIEKLRADYESSRADMQRVTSAANMPPDVKQTSRHAFNDMFRQVNQRIGELLTAEQKKKFASLRSRGRITDTEVGEATSTADDATAATEASEVPTAPSRKPMRPLLTDAEYETLAAELRTKYTSPASEWPAPELDESVKAYYVELGLIPPVSYPTNNPYSDAKAELGKKLFFDPRLSGSQQMACASCHDPELAWGDGRSLSFGHGRKSLKRNSPSILNIGHQKSLFWDGRAITLEEQVVDVINNADEMQSSAEQVRERLNRMPGYTNEFAKVFGSSEITLGKVAAAIATFERTITSRANSFDTFLRGNTNALNDSAVRGLHLFRTTARCANCHHGPLLTDQRFHDEGLSYYSRKLQDLGRYEVTKDAADVGAFKTPSLRNVLNTRPFMHVGLFEIEGVLNLYNAGMPTLRRRPAQKDDSLFPTKSELLQPLGLNKQDLADLKAFMETLNETRLRIPQPALPEGK